MNSPIYVYFLFFSIAITLADANRGGLCNVFDPFKVLPDNNKYQIGGAFPLHESNCIGLQSESVQEIVAIQWALTHWNQNPENANAKMGLFAGDTCTRPKEAISQSLRFLDSVGYHDPAECDAGVNDVTPKLLGLLAPKDADSSSALGLLLKTAHLPIAAYTTESANALVALKIPSVISTAPTLTTYLEVLIKLVKALDSNLVTIVYNQQYEHAVRIAESMLISNQIYIADSQQMDEPNLAKSLEQSDSTIIVSFLDTQKLLLSLQNKQFHSLSKLWIHIPVDGIGLSIDDQYDILQLNIPSNLQIVALQTKHNDLPQFRDYFLRVLKNNYQSYSLLTSYVQQVFNCSLIGTSGFVDCSDLDRDHMASMYQQASAIGPIVRLTYAMAVVGSRLEQNLVNTRLACARPGDKCSMLILDEIDQLDYVFGANDPIEFSGDRLGFTLTTDGIYLSDGIIIEGIELTNDKKSGVSKMIEYETGKELKIISQNLRKSIRTRSICHSYRSFCGKCTQPIRANNDKYFLSIPKPYPIYILGLFDFTQGINCDQLSSSDITLPMAFVHTVWTVRQRYPHLNLLKTIEFGALLADACNNGRHAIKIVSHSDNDCVIFEQANRNLSIVPGTVFGYVSALDGNVQQSLRHYFTSDETKSVLVTTDSETNDVLDTFSSYPTSRSQALAILRFLQTMQWQYVTVVVSNNDTDSIDAFRQFQLLASDRGVCIANTVRLLPTDSTATADIDENTTNVTIVFANTADTIAYFEAYFDVLNDEGKLGLLRMLPKSKQQRNIHVLVGNAHDFIYHHHFKANIIQQLIGTVSIQPADIVHDDFRQWLEMATPLTLPETWFWHFMEEEHNCALLVKSREKYGGRMCTGNERMHINQLGRMTKSGYLTRAVERFLFAMDSVHKKLCGGNTDNAGVCPEFYAKGRTEIIKLLRMAKIEDDFQVYTLVSTNVDTMASYKMIGNWSSSKGLKFTEMYQYYDIDGQPTNTQLRSVCEPPLCKCFIDQDFFTKPIDSTGSYIRREPAIRSINTNPTIATSFMQLMTTGRWRNKPWNYGLLVVITILLLAAIGVLMLIVAKIYTRVVKGNQSLGISLLIGIILLYATAYLFVFDPTDVLCRCRIVCHSLAYTLCFGVMIAKATQLRNAESLGFNAIAHISYWNYWLLLFFIIGVQLALSIQWLVAPLMSAIAVDGSHTSLVCTWAKADFLWSQSYVIILLLLALFLNARNRSIKRNYKETKWLFVSALLCLPIWACWMSSYALIPSIYKDAVVALELVICATILLAFLFGPKIYILLSYEPIIVEYPPTKDNVNRYDLFDRDDDYAPTQRAASPTSSNDDSSTGGGHSSTILTTTSSNTSPRPSAVTSSSSSSSSSSTVGVADDHKPIFHAVIRKKSRVKRIQSHIDSSSAPSHRNQQQQEKHGQMPMPSTSDVHRHHATTIG